MAEDTEVEIKELSLEAFIQKSLALIKAGEYEDAMRLLKDKDAARRYGFRIDHNVTSIGISSTPSEEEAEELGHIQAQHSHFESNRVIPGVPIAFKLSSIYPVRSDVVIPKKLYHNMALVYAEEWLHGLQYQRGMPLAGQGNKEIDVAAYLLRHGVPLTEEFLARYGRADTLREQLMR